MSTAEIYFSIGRALQSTVYKTDMAIDIPIDFVIVIPLREK